MTITCPYEPGEGSQVGRGERVRGGNHHGPGKNILSVKKSIIIWYHYTSAVVFVYLILTLLPKFLTDERIWHEDVFWRAARHLIGRILAPPRKDEPSV